MKDSFGADEKDTSQKKCLSVKQLTDVLHSLPESYTLSPDLFVFNENSEIIGYIDFLGKGSWIQFLSK